MKQLIRKLYAPGFALLFIVVSLTGLSANTPFSQTGGFVVDSVILPEFDLSGEKRSAFCGDIAVSEQAALLGERIPPITQEALQALQLFKAVTLQPVSALHTMGNSDSLRNGNTNTSNESSSDLEKLQSTPSRYIFINMYTGSDCEWKDDALAYVVTVRGKLLMVPQAAEVADFQQLLKDPDLEKLDYHLIGSGLTPELAFQEAGSTYRYYIHDMLFKLLRQHTDYTSLAYIGEDRILITFGTQEELPSVGEHLIIVNPEGRTVAELKILDIVDREPALKKYASAEIVYREVPLFPGMSCEKTGPPPGAFNLQLSGTYGTWGLDLSYSVPLAGISLIPGIHAGTLFGWTDLDFGGTFITNSPGRGGYLGLGIARRISPELYNNKQKKPVFPGVSLEMESMIGLGLFLPSVSGQQELFAGGRFQISIGKTITSRAAIDAGVSYQRWIFTRQPGNLLHSSLSIHSSVTFRL